MAEEKLGDTCPACGVSREMFEPYADPVGESRRRILDMHLHPIAVHFPTSFAAAIVVLLIAGLFVHGTASDYVTHTVKLMALALPVLVLRSKALYGALFFVIAAGLAIFVWTKGAGGAAPRWTSIVLDAGAVACSAVLGILGMRIRAAAFPGK